MIRSISFLESQLKEFDSILKDRKFDHKYIIVNTYESRRNAILRKLSVQYMRSKFMDHENNVVRFDSKVNYIAENK